MQTTEMLEEARVRLVRRLCRTTPDEICDFLFPACNTIVACFRMQNRRLRWDPCRMLLL